MPAIPAPSAPGYWSNASRTQAEGQQWGEDVASKQRGTIGGAGANASQELSSGSFTPTRDEGVLYIIDAQGGSGPDTLDHISTTNVHDGHVIGVAIADNANPITFDNTGVGAGALRMAYNDSPVIDSDKLVMWFMYRSSTTYWHEIFPMSKGRPYYLSNFAAATLFGNATSSSAQPAAFVAGTANQVVSVGTGGNTIEGRTISAARGLNVAFAANSITIGNAYGFTGVPSQRIGIWQTAALNSTTLSVFGIGAPTITANTQAMDITADAVYVNYATTASTNNVASLLDSSASGWARPAHKPRMSMHIQTASSIASMRLWVGLWSGTPSGSDTPNVSMGAFRYSTGAGDTAFQCVTCDGAGNRTVTSSGVTVASNTPYDLVVDMSTSGHVLFYINGVLVQDIATTQPASSTQHGPGLTLTTLTTAAKTIGMSRMYAESF